MGAELLAERLIDSASASTSPLDANGYEQALTDTFLEEYHSTLFAGSLRPDPQRAAALRVIARSEELTETYFSVFSGAVPQEELYTEEFLHELKKD